MAGDSVGGNMAIAVTLLASRRRDVRPTRKAAKRAFDPMKPMNKIDVATIEAALREETVEA
jgi:hypothetical protein